MKNLNKSLKVAILTRLLTLIELESNKSFKKMYKDYLHQLA